VCKLRNFLTDEDAAMHDAVGAIAACGVSPIVRIAASEGWMVKSMVEDCLSV
jgi:4-hydroxy-2-oxoheptanedioate aldolase